MKKLLRLTKLLLTAALFGVGQSVWADPSVTLTSNYAVDNYNKSFYVNFKNSTIDDGTYSDVISVGNCVQRSGYGIQYQSNGSGSFTVSKSISKGDLIILQAGQTGTNGINVSVSSSVSNPIKNDGYLVYYVTANAASFTVTLNKLNYVAAMQVLSPSNSTYIINAVKSDGTFLKQITTGEYSVDATLHYPVCVESDGTYYRRNANGSDPYWSFTNVAAGLRTFVYTQVDYAYYSEMENMSGSSLTAKSFSGTGRFSEGDARRLPSNGNVYTSALPAGIYSVTIYGRNIKNQEKGGVSIKLRRTDNSYTGELGRFENWTSAQCAEKTVTDIIVPENYKVAYCQDGWTSDIDLDYVYVVKTKDINSDVALAIYDCEAYETSSEFDTYIRNLLDNGDLLTALDVYAAHTAWQIEQANANNSNDYSRVIFNHAVTSANGWWGNLTEGANYEGAPDTKYLAWNTTSTDDYNVNQTVKQLPAGTYHASAWTYSSVDAYRKVYVSKVPEQGGWVDFFVSASSENGWVELSGDFTLTEPTNVAFGFYANKYLDRTAGFDNWMLTKVTSASLTINASGYATFASDFALDFANATGVKAYYATNDVVNDGKINMKMIEGSVPAGTGLFLQKVGVDPVSIPVVASYNTDMSANLLKRGTGAEVMSVENGITCYVLANQTEGIGFYKLGTTGVKVATNKAYLELPASVNPSRLAFVFDDGEATGIKNVAPVYAENEDAIYNLSGQRVSQPKKGLYVVGGKKVMVK